LAFAGALAAMAAGLTYLMVRYVRIMDIPNERSMHREPTPKSGGVAIVLTFVVGSLAIYGLATIARIDAAYFWTFLIGGGILALVSFYDDIYQKSFHAKLTAQLLCATAVSLAGLVVTKIYVPMLGEFDIGFGGYLVTLIWIVGLTNAYNFMDGMDGLAGGVGLIAAIFLGIIAFHEDSVYVYMTSYVLAAGLAGFLIFNFPPAKIFMGDVGSAFVGYSFAVLALLGAAFDRGHLSLYIVPMLLFQFVFDTSFTFVRRLLSGEMVLQPHRTHLYQLLPQLGFTHQQVILFHYLVAVVQGIGAFWLIGTPAEWRPMIFFPFLLFNASYAVWVIRRAKRLRLM
jgi:UDP-GlcNAc:undecaprenyl-phosphate/decaprenyl-phosphate GlcNAc-1-phosphate transferase